MASGLSCSDNRERERERERERVNSSLNLDVGCYFLPPHSHKLPHSLLSVKEIISILTRGKFSQRGERERHLKLIKIVSQS